ncbi:hypothetical protein JCM19314_2677 [Nonlabens ulvanivorans]|uniref:Uncharacterized protein n=1 Tax=Nonlabens ulvanivorans TaxID=906888 RepID=A0A090QT39_NONUL|nr:hypothetical protein JCM19314_2677 [Nonlabens ulvanivorans]
MSEIGLIITGVLFLILLIGLRILQDYRGAGRTAFIFFSSFLVYFGYNQYKLLFLYIK